VQDLAMLSLELIQNSLQANATRIDLTVLLNQNNGTSSLRVADNGWGMDESTLSQVSSPFFTTRTTRNVGFGVAFFKQAIQQANGTCQIVSALNQGTTVTGVWQSDHWDAPPLGNLGEVVLIALQSHPELQLIFNFSTNLNVYTFDSKTFETSIAPVPISELAILKWIESEINMNIQQCKGEIKHEKS